MKKLIFVFATVLAFSATTYAQDKKVAPASEDVSRAQSQNLNLKAAAKQDLSKSVDVLGLTNEQTNALYQLFEKKHQLFNSPEAAKSAEYKESVSKMIEEKLRATLTPEQVEKLDSNPSLLKHLTH